ncbi:hypothetical protein B0T18DRAFT_404758 [Schizothecium vesticola]|uniref:Uncharacterized protein n=1 Tax=Schizothecium vesticola TaxID=314040 RepID=A0AA40KBA4_9PEZI|nr:hypothetical protein B0T18DRAFT_404758 [Schizothecium vesticola]
MGMRGSWHTPTVPVWECRQDISAPSTGMMAEERDPSEAPLFDPCRHCAGDSELVQSSDGERQRGECRRRDAKLSKRQRRHGGSADNLYRLTRSTAARVASHRSEQSAIRDPTPGWAFGCWRGWRQIKSLCSCLLLAPEGPPASQAVQGAGQRWTSHVDCPGLQATATTRRASSRRCRRWLVTIAPSRNELGKGAEQQHGRCKSELGT